MRWTRFFLPTMKEAPAGAEADSHRLMLRAGLIHMLTSGVYAYLPLGLRVLDRITEIIRKEMEAAGAREVVLPMLQPLEIWKKTGRDAVMAEIMIRFRDNRGREMCLGPTHEEAITELVGSYVHSYRQLPVVLYQIQTKFRDELRTRFGVVRACEFLMKDAYSFDRDEEGLRRNYEIMFQAYRKIFAACALPVVIVEADSGAMGGSVSHEFLAVAPIGEDKVFRCLSCGHHFADGADGQEDGGGRICPRCAAGDLDEAVAMELGHIFQLGTKYATAQGAFFLDEEGRRRPMIMGCYGIGVSRLTAAIIERHHDERGIVWPETVAPFDVELLPLQEDERTRELAQRLERDLSVRGWNVLVDDRSESAGRKFNDADLIGIPWRVILGRRALREGLVEIKKRKTGGVVSVAPEDLVDRLERLRAESSVEATAAVAGN